MFLNISTGGDLRRIVVRVCACLLIVGLVGHTLIIGPIPLAKANVAHLPAPISAPPEPFEVPKGGGILSLLPEASGDIASLFTFAAPKSNESKDSEAGFEKAVLEPFRNSELGTSNPEFSSPPAAGDVEFDFDGDNKADIGRWRGVATEFKVKNSGSGGYSTYTLGSSGAVAAPGDFNGDGQTDACVFNGTTWTYKTSPSASAQTISFGSAGDIPYAGDYDGDGITDAAIYRPSTNYWWIRQSSNSATVSYNWGAAGDIPITGNWDGDSKTDIAVYRPSNGTWYIQKSSGGSLYLNWGLSYDIPVQGDFDGDGKSDATVFRPTTGTWYILKSSSNWTAYSAANWGLWSDQPVPADYDGDGITDLAVWRPTDGNWYILKSTDNSYEVHTLGIAGDTAVPSAYTKQVGGTASGDVINAERVKPRNAAGGTNLYSQNFGWGTSLVSLPGRAGLDAGFGIGYKSLLWLKVGNAMYFDPDKSNMTPGFQFGFPVIEPIYYDNDKQKYAYMMVTPSGSRIEFRQTAASNVYETADSSYTQLVVPNAENPFDPVENLSMKVTTTDGTQMTYAWAVNSYKCTRIQDRNGNYITLAYDSLARLSTMTDTLGRVVTVNYDVNNGLPSTITQTWRDNNGQGTNVTHTWATFAYTTKAVDTDFATSLSIIGPPDGTVFTVLDKITYPDGSSTKFEYNDYLQVKKVSSIAADSASHVLNYVSTNLAAPTSAQTDCPRFTETKSWTENFNQNTSGTAQEVVVTNSLTTGATYNLPGSITGSATRIDVTMTGHPDNLITRTYVGASGYKDGLPLATEDCLTSTCTGTDRKRWTWTDWTQDDTSKSYITNPRVIETRVGDGTNTKRSTVEYYPVSTGSPVALYGLVKNAFVYDTDLTTVLKQTYAEYNLDTAYTSRRIIGLPSNVLAYGRETSGLNLMSKVTYAYDEGNFSDTTLNQNITPVQHDTSYSSSLINGRANLTSTTRCDVTLSSTTTCGGGIASSVKYNTAGAVVAQITPWDGTNTRTTKVDYTDNWNASGVSTNTFAYPTKLYDPAGNFSQVKYRFDIGANVWAQSPAPAGNTTGKITERLFDSIGRVSKETLLNTGAYTRYEYPTNGVQSKVFSTIVDTNNNDTGDSADEVLSESWSDGAGRVRRSRTEHPGSTGGWSATQTEYDLLGRVYRSSVPTEISVSGTTWTVAGDDATRGWIWNYAYYDWKSRTIKTVPSDSTGSDGKDTLISYEGCGCAGGQMTTVQGPLVPRDDQPTLTARRKQKIYEDILGRQWKTEALDWAGNVYLTSQHSFNGRDQILQTTQTEASTSTVQTTTATFDGHARPLTLHEPNDESGTQTAWTYNQDDSVSTVTDPRGAVTTYTYGNPNLPEKRPLLLGISYAPPSTQPPYTTIPDASDVSYTYDALANRITMSNGNGSTTYAYDSLSRLTSEQKTITGLSGNFTLSYTYQLSGKLKSITDPFGAVINYSDDKTGRTTSITGANFAGQTNYATGIEYRAFGGIKQMTYGSQDNSSISYGYDDALRTSTYQSTSSVLSGGFVRKASYEYFADGRAKKVTNLIDSGFDQNFKFDSQARMTSSISGQKLNNQSQMEEPFKQSISYNAFGDMTGRTNEVWGAASSFTASYTNGRKTIGNEIYDKAGNLVDKTPGSNVYERWKYDASGRNVETVYRWFQSFGSPQVDTTQTIAKSFDGDGLDVKRVDTNSWFVTYPEYNSGTYTTTEYYVRSTVLGGQVLTKLDETGAKKVTNVYTGSSVLAEQRVSGPNSEVFWRHEDSVTGSYNKIGVNGQQGGYAEDSPDAVEYDPLGGLIEITDPTDDFIPAGMSQFKFAGDNNRSEYGCKVDGIMQDGPGPCTRILRHGGGYLDPKHEQPSSVLGSWGFHIRWNPVSGRAPRKLPPDTEFHSYTQIDGGIWEVMFFGQGTDWIDTRQSDRVDDINCYTFYKLIYENPDVRKYMDDAWKRAVQSVREGHEAAERHRGVEHGGVITFDEKKYDHSFWEFTGMVPPKAGQPMEFDFSPQIKDFKNQAVAGGRDGRVILVIHTHNPNGPVQMQGPFATRQQYEALLNWEPSVLTGDPNPSTADSMNMGASYYGPGPFFGVVVHGIGKFTVYGPGKSDIDTLKKTCVRRNPL